MKKTYLILVILLLASKASAGGFGPWEFDMSKQEVTSFRKFGPYKAVKSTGGVETPNGVYNGKKTNISFIFHDNKLKTIQIWAYEGKDFKKSLNAWVGIYDYITKQYGEVEFPDIKSDKKLSRDDIILLFTKTMGNIPEAPSGVEATIKFQMTPIIQPSDQVIYASYFNHTKYGYYVFLYVVSP